MNLFEGTTRNVYGPPEERRDPLKIFELIIFGLLWVRGAIHNILTSIVSNSHFGNRPIARDMTICWSHVGPRASENVYLIDDFARTRPPSHLQGRFLVFHYCHVDEKSDSVCTTYGGWIF